MLTRGTEPLTVYELTRELEFSPLELTSDRLGIRALVRALLEWGAVLPRPAQAGGSPPDGR
jgi:hypothetical protein